MNLDAYTRAMMVRFAVEEAQRYGGINNMLAVLHVLRNRVFAGWGDWVEVIERAPERRGNVDDHPPRANMRHSDVRIVLIRADDIYSRDDTSDLTGGALWYVDQNLPVQDWFQRQVLERSEDHARVAHIGPVWFFK